MKRIGLGLMVAIILAISYFWFASGQEEATPSDAGSSQPRTEKQKHKPFKGFLSKPDQNSEEPLIKDVSDLEKLSPDPINNKKELKELVNRIVHLEFPECELAKEHDPKNCQDPVLRESFDNCILRINYEVLRIRMIRDKNLVPELIKVAEKNEYQYGSWIKGACDERKVEVNQMICSMRFSAIYALGEINDPKAVEPLLGLLDEPVPDISNSPKDFLNYGCAVLVPGEGDDQIGYICSQALKALLKIEIPESKKGLVPDLIKEIDKIEEGGDEENLSQSIQASCKIAAASKLGGTKLDSMLEKYYSPNTSEAKKQALLYSISQIRDPNAIPKLKELMRHPELDPGQHGYGKAGNLSQASAQALIGMALPELIPEYIWMIESGEYVELGCEALGTIKDPSTVKYLIQVLQTNYGEHTGYTHDFAARALTEMGPMAREAVPVLIERLTTCKDCQYIAQALGAIGDEAAVPALSKFVLENPQGDVGISALGMIGTDSAMETLKMVIINENRNISVRISSMQILARERGDQERSFFCGLKDDPKLHDVAIAFCQDGPK